MVKKKGVQSEWLKVVYILNIVAAGGLGLCILIIPNQMKKIFPFSGDPATYGILGSVFLSFGLFAALGLREPLKFVPILLFQLTCMVIWLVASALPLALMGKFPSNHTSTVVLFTIAIVVDATAIPFRQIFSKKSG